MIEHVCLITFLENDNLKIMKQVFYLLRHGETSYQTKETLIIYPFPEEENKISLTEEGREQVKERVEELKSKNISAIYSSDIARTKETAEIVASKIRIKPIFAKELREINLGDFKGKPISLWREFVKNSEFPFVASPRGGESFKDCQDRVWGFVNNIKERAGVLIVSHGASLLLIQAKLENWSSEEFLKKRKSLKFNLAELRKVEKI